MKANALFQFPVMTTETNIKQTIRDISKEANMISHNKANKRKISKFNENLDKLFDTIL